MERNIGYPAAMVDAVQVRVGWAQVELTPADIAEVRAVIAGDERSVREMIVRHENGRMTIEQPQYGLLPHLDSKWLQVGVQVPRDWCGNIGLTAISGSVTVRNVRGREVSVDTVSGTVHADRVRCERLTMQAVSGAVQATRVSGETLRLRNVSSSIGLFEAGFDTVRIVTVTGQVNLDFEGPFRALDLQAATGDTQITLPGDRAEVTFHSVAGRLSAEGFTGGEGAPVVLATTVAGNLRVMQAEQERSGEDQGANP
jgi:hypothetical protein